MEHNRPDAADAEEVLDQELTAVLQAHGQMLEERSHALLAHGAVSIVRPGVILSARLRVPRWWRQGLLEISAEDPVSGAVRSSSSIPLGKAGRNRASLLREITVHLGGELPHGHSS